MIVVSKDANQMVFFLMETKKKLTEIIKRLLGISRMNIWEESGTSVTRVLDGQSVKERIAYILANPAQDDLVDCIEQFPGVSSWDEIMTFKAALNGKSSNRYPWIRFPSIPRLKSRAPSEQTCRKVVESLQNDNEEQFDLVCEPNAWMRCFGVTTDEEAARLNDEIVYLLRQREEDARKQRGPKPVMGPKKLVAQPIMKSHTPRKHGPKVRVIASDPEGRRLYLEMFRSFCALCKECYRRWKKGELSVVWPPEAFKPPLPPVANIIGCSG
jgi:hypothetical protein